MVFPTRIADFGYTISNLIRGRFMVGRVEALCVSHKGNVAKEEIELTLEGIVGDSHSGFTRKSDVRDTGIKRGTAVRNWRQWSAVSSEELAVVAERLGIDFLDPALLTANLCFSGIPDFTRLPRGTTLWFPSGAVLTVEEENEPCLGPGKEINACHPKVVPAAFPKAAVHLRGLVGVIYQAGLIRVGDAVEVKVYQPFAL
jgi:hypothetical protein